jgi:hypothetical protein
VTEANDVTASEANDVTASEANDVTASEARGLQALASREVWTAASATARGSSHVRSGLPNQDAALVRTVAESNAVVAAVADGHGGARYVRSDIGALFAVSIACEIGARFVAARGTERDRTIARHAAVELVPQLVEQWTATVHEHAAHHPFTAEERTRAGVDLDHEVAFAYGATLLFAIATLRWVLVGQLGDGDVITVDGTSAVSRPIPRDSRLVAGQTTSLCLPDAARDLRLSVVPAGDAEVLLLASDGYGNSFAGADWWQAVGRDLRAQVRDQGLSSVGASLPEWVADSAEVGGDDVTVAVLARTIAAAGGALAATVPAVAPSGPSAARRRARRWPLVAAVVLVVLALAGAAVAVVTAGDDSGADDEPPATTGVTTGVTTTTAGAVATTAAPRSDVNQAKLTVTAPTAALTWVATSAFALAGEVDPGATVTIATVTAGADGAAVRVSADVPVGSDGQWSWTTELAPYTNQFEIVATDPGHGLNARTVTRTVEYRPNLPAVVIERPTGSAPHRGSITISGTAERFSEIILDGTVVAGTGLGTTWSFDHTVTRDETLSLTARNPLGEGPPTTLLLRYDRPTPTTSAPPSGGTAAPPPPLPTTTTTTTNPEAELRSEEVER